jgi:WD40 repeat protein
MRLLESASVDQQHEGEVFACAYSPDGAFVLSGGWDGQLRLWDSTSGASTVTFQASPRPLSACAFSPDGQRWLSGTMEGLLHVWDPVSHHGILGFLAHTRPISGITYSPDAQFLATCSWDRHIILRRTGKERDGRSLSGHLDIVAGCRFTLDGKYLLSWSHDRTLRLWDLDLGKDVHTFSGHTDRITCGSLSPDGRWAVSGSRDQTVRLWDLERRLEIATVNVGAEVRAVLFLLDAESVIVVDAAGRIFLMGIPDFEVQDQLQTGLKFLCADLAPSGLQLALGGEDGRVHRLGLEGRENTSVVVTATQTVKPASGLGRFLGGNKLTRSYRYICPVCRLATEASKLPAQPVVCSGCRQSLRINSRFQVLQSC